MPCTITPLAPLAECDHLIADATVALALNARDGVSSADETQLMTRFGIRPEDIVDIAKLTRTRPDLLVANLAWSAGLILTSTGQSQLDPHVSATVRDVANGLGLDVRQGLLADLKDGDRHARYLDAWTVPRADMQGDWPKVVFHGTSTVFWPDIDRDGLITTAPSNWPQRSRQQEEPAAPQGPRDEISLSASPYVAAFHAARTAFRKGGEPIVLSCLKPRNWDVDHDVLRDLIDTGLVRRANARQASQEAGLLATPDPIARAAILAVHAPRTKTPFGQWPTRP
jgi:hypothetical protein